MSFGILLFSIWLIGFAAPKQQSNSPDKPLAHIRNEFSFTIDAPYEEVAPLFGAEAERAWAGHKWNPGFIHPSPAADVQGAVFTIQHGGHNSVWVNTAFDLKTGHVQYVYVLDTLLVTLIDINIERVTARRTTVRVAYERTALVPEANDHVKNLGQSDAKMGEQWSSAIRDYLKARKR